jgi:hypothetical protein
VRRLWGELGKKPNSIFKLELLVRRLWGELGREAPGTGSYLEFTKKCSTNSVQLTANFSQKKYQ